MVLLGGLALLPRTSLFSGCSPNRHQLAWVSVGGLNGSCGKAYCKPKKNVLLVEASFPDPEASAASQRVLLLFGDLFLSRNIIGDNVFDSNFHGGKKTTS